MGTGYKGRTGIFEVLELDEGLKQFILKTQDATAIKRFAKEKGFKDMLQDGVNKVLQGITTSEELIRAIKVE
jgi:general secretion pathway protein E